jgi:prepilin-type N-terminal cleavage/methylation domain-containing protein
MSKTGTKFMHKGERGFSLIEVAIAIALIGIIAVAILSSVSYANMVLIITDRQATAESLAKSQMEYVKNQGYEPADDEDVAIYDEIPLESIPYGYSIWGLNRTGEDPDVVGIPWSSENNTAVYSDNGLQKITVIIKYEILGPENSKVQKQFILEGYKRDPEIQTEV